VSPRGSPFATKESPRKITTPKEAFGFNVGDDYMARHYPRDRVPAEAGQGIRPHEAGQSPTAKAAPVHGHHLYGRENMKNLEHYREISQKLALAKD